MKKNLVVLILSVVGMVGFVLDLASVESIPESTRRDFQSPTQSPYLSPSGESIPPRPPLITRVAPTAQIPASTNVQISHDQAIAKAMTMNSEFAALQAGGRVTVTATLTTWGDYRKQDRTRSRFHPSLPIWVVEMETPTWTQWAGPVGNQVLLKFRGYTQIIDAVTGESLEGSRIFAGEAN
jgi:hypothetical protein